jgi:sulfate/thiosulfate transport system permease protein
MQFKQSSVLPGFNLAFGFTIFYLCLIVLIPLSALIIKTASLTLSQFWDIVTAERVVAAYKLTLAPAL